MTTQEIQALTRWLYENDDGQHNKQTWRKNLLAQLDKMNDKDLPNIPPMDEATTFKPLWQERYWMVDKDRIEDSYWVDDSNDKISYELGNCYATREEAESALVRVKHAYKAKYSILYA